MLIKRFILFIWIILSIPIISIGVMGIIWGIRIHFTECTIISISLLACYTLVNIAGYLIGKNIKKQRNNRLLSVSL